MTLKELKEWVNNLPGEFENYEIMNGEFGVLDTEHVYRLDKPVTTLYVDQENKEILILNDIEEKEDDDEDFKIKEDNEL